jgi:hypothetical protein
MPAHSPSKTGVNALLSRASTSLRDCSKKDVDGRDKPGHDESIYGMRAQNRYTLVRIPL